MNPARGDFRIAGRRRWPDQVGPLASPRDRSMPAQRIGMRDAREIIRLKASSVSTHEIARRLGMATDVALPPASFTHDHRRMNTCFVVYRRFDKASPRLEAVNLLHFGKNNDPGHSTNLSLHSRKVTGEARGIPRILENADGSVVVGHAPTALVFLDIISGVVAANAGDAIGPCGPWIAHPRAIRNALTRAKRIGQPTASARTKFGSLVCGATRRRNTKTAAAASQTKSRVPEDRPLNSVESSVLIARLQRSTPTIGIVRCRPTAH